MTKHTDKIKELTERIELYLTSEKVNKTEIHKALNLIEMKCLVIRKLVK